MHIFWSHCRSLFNLARCNWIIKFPTFSFRLKHAAWCLFIKFLLFLLFSYYLLLHHMILLIFSLLFCGLEFWVLFILHWNVYSDHLNTGPVRYSNGPFQLEPGILKPDHLKTNIFVWFSNSLLAWDVLYKNIFIYVSIGLAYGALKNRTGNGMLKNIRKPKLNKSEFQLFMICRHEYKKIKEW